ncbi:thiamine phosphate synthase [Prevotella herbatica]|uniref:Thiamine phosphate synthase n=1 Tax=Prevotella herbatica TaxID=2801997 RepID=A0ABN6EF81_9BACT|nr:thiamine phosphate synthase [Prevotella herbatica]BCS84487.1 thiamine phosphate synthase [Prevotella herbatica]
MKIIVITTPNFIKDEVSVIPHLLQLGVDIVHIRKPSATREQLALLLDSLPKWCYDRLVVHDCLELANEYHLRGIHLNRRNHAIPDNFTGSLSMSCHSLEEVEIKKDMADYVFLSPIFNSISKSGYNSAFSKEELHNAMKQGTIDHKVIALGGVSAVNIDTVKDLGFGGAALLGDIWDKTELPDFDDYIKSLIER